MTGDEEKIYDLIVRRFLAAFHPPYEYEETQVHTEIEGEMFYSRGYPLLIPDGRTCTRALRKKRKPVRIRLCLF